MKPFNKAIFSVFIVPLLIITVFVLAYSYLNKRLTRNSVEIVRPEEGIFNRSPVALPEGIEIITEEEFLRLMEEEAEDLTDEEMRQAIEMDFIGNNVQDEFISGNMLDILAALMHNDFIYEREEISDRIINILFLGDDARLHQNRGRSDTIILISYNRDTKVINLTSFMRDTLVPISLTSTYWNRINTMYAIGGPGRTINLINNLFSLDIQRYAVVRFTGVFALVDALGGLEMYLRADEAIVLNRIFPEFDQVSEGVNLLNGRQVLAYSRMRVIDHDLARTQRQRNVLRSILNKILDTNNIGDILAIATFALGRLQTNVSLDEIIAIGFELFSGSRPIVEELRIPIDGSFLPARYNGANIFVIDFEENIIALHESIYGNAAGVWIPEFTLPGIVQFDNEPAVEVEHDRVNEAVIDVF
ncbi:MAG: LCP family protein [Treponema sp.]|nr:LCP family protein [Treponema sp.]